MAFSKLATIGTLATLAAFVPQVAAHGHVTGIVVDGTWYEGFLPDSFPYMTNPPAVIGWTTTATDNGFATGYNNADIICHNGATNAKLSAPIAAGKDITLEWTAWPDSHHGPVTDYLANCNGDCTTVDKTTLEFVKIDAGGLVSDTTIPGEWASDQLIANNNSWTVTIPSNIAPGNYVLRHEIIALHGAESANGAQAYPQCINLNITGSGTAAPTGTLGEKLYTATDPGILVNIYQSLSTYDIPGPAIPTEFASSGSSGSASAVATSAAATSSAVATSAASSAVATSAASTSVASSSAAAVTSAATSAAATTLSSATTSAASSAVTSVASVSSQALPATSATATSAVASSATSAAATATATGSSSSISLTGMTVTQLLDLLKSILQQLFESSSTTTSSKARRHARDLAI